MEHPLRVDEFFPSEALQSGTVAQAAAVASAPATTAAALPPLPNLAESDALLLFHHAQSVPLSVPIS
jgi:hypothetical protein